MFSLNIIKTNYLLGGLLAISLALAEIQANRSPATEVFIVDQNGNILPAPLIDQPIQPISKVTTWMTSSVVQAETYDFAGYAAEFVASKKNFTAAGWHDWQSALHSSGQFEAVKNNKMTVTATPTGTPKLESSGVENGVYTWNFDFPAKLSYGTMDALTRQDVLFHVKVVRVPFDRNTSGMAIQSIVAE